MKSIYDARYHRVIAKLTDVRKKQGLTQAQVANSIGWRRTMLTNVELFERRLDFLEAYLLAGVLGLKLLDLESVLASDKDDDN